MSARIYFFVSHSPASSTKFIAPGPEETDIIVLNADRWVLEVHRTVIGTLQSVAWMLLVFFVFALPRQGLRPVIQLFSPKILDEALCADMLQAPSTVPLASTGETHGPFGSGHQSHSGYLG